MGGEMLAHIEQGVDPGVQPGGQHHQRERTLPLRQQGQGLDGGASAAGKGERFSAEAAWALRRQPIEAEVEDLSAGGALIACDHLFHDGERCQLELDGLAAPVAALIRPAEEGHYHLLFEHMDADLTLALTKHLDRFYFRI